MNKGIESAIVESILYQYKGKETENLEELIEAVVGKMFSEVIKA